MKIRLRSLALPAFIVVTVASAHVWMEDQGIHFKSIPVDFGQPPVRETDLCSDFGKLQANWRPGTDYYIISQDSSVWISDYYQNRMIAASLKVEQNGGYEEAANRWRHLAHLGLIDPWFVRERIDFYHAAWSLRTSVGVKQWLQGVEPNHAGQLPVVGSADPVIRPFIEYEAAVREADPEERARKFQGVWQTYPKSLLAEPALIMIPRILLDVKESPNHQDFAACRTAMTTLQSRYPKSRFWSDELGFEGRLLYLRGRYREASAVYEKQLERTTRAHVRCRAFESIVRCHRKLNEGNAVLASDYLKAWSLAMNDHDKWEWTRWIKDTMARFSAHDAREFWHRARQDPTLLASYLDFRIDFTETTPELLTLVARNDAAASSELKTHILAKMAEAAYGLNRFSQASSFASFALRKRAKGDDDALATFVFASCAKRRHRDAVAVQSYRLLIKNHPKSYLVGGARENLAILYERLGRLDQALDLYRRLNYQGDVAYMLDARMSLDQLRSYVNRSDNRRDGSLRLSLSYRLLRVRKFADAAREAAKVSKSQRRRLLAIGSDFIYRDNLSSIRDPYTTARELDWLFKATSLGSRAQRATALIRMGDYYYNRRTLLLYNPAIWHATRTDQISFAWNMNAASPADTQALRRHEWEHECYAQAYRLYEQGAKAAKGSARLHALAAYKAGVSLEHLANMNPYWRDENYRDGLVKQAAEWIRVASRSPDSASVSAPISTRESLRKSGTTTNWSIARVTWIGDGEITKRRD